MDTSYLLLDTVVASKPALKILWEFIISHWEWTSGIAVTCGTGIYAFVRKCYKFVREMNLLKRSIPSMQTDISKMTGVLLPPGKPPLNESIDDLKTQCIINNLLIISEFDDSDSAIMICDKDGNVKKVNKTLTKWLNEPSDNLKEDGWFSFVTNQYRNYVRAEIERAIKEKRGINDLKFQLKRNGSILYDVELVLTPLRLDGIIYANKIQLKLM